MEPMILTRGRTIEATYGLDQWRGGPESRRRPLVGLWE